MEHVKQLNTKLDFAKNVHSIAAQAMGKFYFTRAIEDCLPVADCFDARKVLLTGNAGGYAVAVAGLAIWKQYTDIFWGTEIIRQSDFLYFNTIEALGIGEPRTPLVVVVDLEGDDEYVTQTLEKARQIGANSLLICAKSHSVSAQAAHNTLYLDIDQTIPNYYETAYITAFVALMSAALRCGRVRGTFSELDAETIRTAFLGYMQQVADAAMALDAEAAIYAGKYYHNNQFDILADASERGAAYLLQYIVTTELGGLCSVNDTEEWCHVNYWDKDISEYHTILFATAVSKSFSRAIETMRCITIMGRPYMLVTDADADAFMEGAEPCRIPELSAEYGWMAPSAQIIPPLLVVGHCKAMREQEGSYV